MDDLTPWLREQIDEDERVANAAHPITSATVRRWSVKPYERRVPGAGLRPMRFWGVVAEPRESPIMADAHEPAVADHIARHDPARVLREVKAKRGIIGEHAERPWPHEGECQKCTSLAKEKWSEDALSDPWPCNTIRLLASVYSDRPGYQPEWTP